VSTKTDDTIGPKVASTRRRLGKPAPANDVSRSAAATVAAAPVTQTEPTTNGDRELLEALVSSKIFADYERAFTEATGLPVALRSVESWQLPHHGKRNEGPFCALMGDKSRSCGACLEVQEELSEAAAFEPYTAVCQAGLSDTAVPVRLGDRLIGFLQTGQIFRKKPTERQFQRTLKVLAEWGVNTDREELRKAYFATRVVEGKQHASVIKLLSIFAQHLSILSNQILIQRNNSESPVITKAKAFIRDHHTENLRLGQVARFVNTSPFYFCKMFKKGTGLNFTDYLSRIRVERSKNLLLNPNLRVSEIAYEVGFQSLTHFNRVFKNTLGQSPTRYRERLLGH
jgi:AraC-like DNA-binding protein